MDKGNRSSKGNGSGLAKLRNFVRERKEIERKRKGRLLVLARRHRSEGGRISDGGDSSVDEIRGDRGSEGTAAGDDKNAAQEHARDNGREAAEDCVPLTLVSDDGLVDENSLDSDDGIRSDISGTASDGSVDRISKRRTFGRLVLAENERIWKVEVEPHVAMRLKRVFGKINRDQHGAQFLSATDENCRELEWFMDRYPLEVTKCLGVGKCGKILYDDRAGASALNIKARAYDDRCSRTFDILSGDYSQPSDVEMVKPARDYQEVAAALTINNGSLLLADELGLGKTVSAIRTIVSNGALPALVVCPTHMPDHWKEKLKEFTPKLKTHIVKKGTPYEVHKPGTRWPDVLIISYSKIRGWAEFLANRVTTIVFDECQELRRRTSQKYYGCKHIADSTEIRMGLSATPIYNYGNEFWSVLNVLKDGCLGTRDEFM